MEQTLRVTLVANAGLLIRFGNTTLLMDGIYGTEGHPFSNLPPDLWRKMEAGEPPFETIDYLLFTHAHPDHFSPQMTADFLRHRKVKGVFAPDTRSVRESELPQLLKDSGTPAVFLSEGTDHAAYRIEPQLTVRAFSTRHLDRKFYHVHDFCYLITFGDKNILFTADVDYTSEDFSRISRFPLHAAFVNPLFFADLRRGRLFHGVLNPTYYCIYHVPFSKDDGMHMRPTLANDLVKWPMERQGTFVLCDALQHIEL